MTKTIDAIVIRQTYEPANGENPSYSVTFYRYDQDAKISFPRIYNRTSLPKYLRNAIHANCYEHDRHYGVGTYRPFMKVGNAYKYQVNAPDQECYCEHCGYPLYVDDFAWLDEKNGKTFCTNACMIANRVNALKNTS